jgi:hypothetical protein
MFNRLIRERGPLFAAMTTNLIPAGAVFSGWLDAERVTGLQMSALAGVVSMVALVQYASRRVEAAAISSLASGEARAGDNAEKCSSRS